MIYKGQYAASNFFRKRGIELDLGKRIFRQTEKVFSFIPIREKWKKLPPGDYILIFKTLYAKCEQCGIDDFEDEAKGLYQVSLVHNKNRRLIVHETQNKIQAFELADLLSRKLKLGIRDAASSRRKPVFIAYKAA